MRSWEKTCASMRARRSSARWPGTAPTSGRASRWSTRSPRPACGWKRRERNLHAQLELAERQPGHAQQQPPVAEAVDLRLAVAPRPVAHRHLDDLQSQPRGSEEEIEIAEGIEIAEVRPPRRQPPVGVAPEHLGAAEGVLDAPPENPGEGEAEELVARHVQQAHRLVLHRVDEARAVDELALAFGDGEVELGQILRRHGQVGVEDEEHVPLRRLEALAHGVALAGVSPLAEEAR